jgi:23S rRNA (adenine2503-C2)-methyltransferase
VKTHIKTLIPLKDTEELFSGIKGFQLKIINEWILNKGILSFDEMTNISIKTREKLKEIFLLNSLSVHEIICSGDKTRKISWKLNDGLLIESVLIYTPERITACISSQAGCPLGCRFCATGNMGFYRNLSREEIHDQIVYLMHLSEEFYKSKLSNIVVMGMGEPFLNYEALMGALDLISNKDYMNFSPQRITVSTAGIVDGIKKMGDEQKNYKLAISLHTANEIKRRQIMPMANKYSLNELKNAMLYYHQKTENRLIIEYILFKGFNDSIKDAEELAVFCKSFPVKINLIPYNPTGIKGFSKPASEQLKFFESFLKGKNIVVHLRKSRGDDIFAACGQLANKNKK